MNIANLEDKKQREQCQRLGNKIKSDFSFGKVKIFKDILVSAGFSEFEISKMNYQFSQLVTPITFADVKNYIEDLRLSLEAAIFLKNNPPDTSDLKSFYDSAWKKSEEPEKEKTEEDYLEEHKDILSLFPVSVNENVFLFWFQKKAITELWIKAIKEKKRGLGLFAGTGVGKTFIAGALFRRLLDAKYAEGKTVTPFPYIYVTKASIIEQTKRVLNKYFKIDTVNEVLVINYDQLRSKFGELFVTEEVEIIQGQEHFVWKWRKLIFPVVILWDEFHSLKNTDSKQSQIGSSYNDIDSEHTLQIFMSATPFTRVSEAKCFSVATRIPYKFAGQTKPLNNNTWKYFADEVASPQAPDIYSPAAVERLVQRLDDYIVRVKGVKTQFHANNSVNLINFTTQEGQKFYDDSWQKFLDKKAKIEGDASLSLAQGKFQMFAQLTIFRIAAESNPDRIRYLAANMVKQVKNGLAAVCALNFKSALIALTKELIEVHGIPRSQISLIWGGGQSINKKQKLKADIEANKDILDALAAEGITMEDLDLDDIEAKTIEEFPKEYQLGAQNLKQRQIEIDKFQSGKSLYCIYTIRAGGVGLSLHHSDEQTKEKVGRKKSGFAIEADIPKIPTRQRKNIVAPTYSAIELVQALGRVPRLTSLSDTEQVLTFFKGTIEERVAKIVSMKLKCLAKVARTTIKESWESVILGSNPDNEEKKYLSSVVKDKDDDENELVNEPTEDDLGKNV